MKKGIFRKRSMQEHIESDSMIHRERIQHLNKKEVRKGRYVLYWMQASQRTEYNHALEYALLRANELLEPVVVFFGITDVVSGANERQYYFMLEGLREVKLALEKKGICMVIQHVSPEKGAIQLAENASLLIVDRGYLKIEKEWRQSVAERVNCPVIQVESNVVVPVEEASLKEEYAAATVRPKIERNLEYYLVPLQENSPRIHSLDMGGSSFDIEDLGKAISQLEIDRTVQRVKFKGGTKEGKKHLNRFTQSRIDRYAELRNDPTVDCLSNMSPYLHFGQISPLFIALEILKIESPGRTTYLEELIVRRELSINFVHYNKEYDSFEGLPGWARKTLRDHTADSREYVYTLKELENSQTHDCYWNAAQKEMMVTGKMHGYMRMYWGKKILEWSKTPEEAFSTALYLNNKYELDGRGPNGFTGVAWCFGKHDRPWKERPIFGKVRYMNARGLRRKFDADGYVEKVEHY
jgi:deoxyribodipyrimidine photo-lyase